MGVRDRRRMASAANGRLVGTGPIPHRCEGWQRRTHAQTGGKRQERAMSATKKNPHGWLYVETAWPKGICARLLPRNRIEIVPMAAIAGCAAVYELDMDTAERQLRRMQREKRINWDP